MTDRIQFASAGLVPPNKRRGYRLSCGCCVGPEEDRCCCWNHQDRPRGILPKKCTLHQIEHADCKAAE